LAQAYTLRVQHVRAHTSMVLQHLVWFEFPNWKEDSEEEKEFIRRVHEFPERMPGLVLFASAGRNFSENPTGCAHGIIVTLPDKESLQKYLDHPVHQELIAYIGDNCKQKLKMDWIA